MFDFGIENVDDIVILYIEWQYNEILGIFLNVPGRDACKLFDTMWNEAVKFRYNYPISCKSYSTVQFREEKIFGFLNPKNIF